MSSVPSPALLLEHASWITTPVQGGEPGSRPGYEFRRTFQVVAPTAAELVATAHGVYEAFINGVRVGDEELTPGFTSYRKTLSVQRFDAGHLLRDGSNELRIVVTDGWFRGRTGPHRLGDQFGTRTALLASLRATTGAGDVTVGTGLGWEVGTGAILAADLMDGQRTDLRRAEVADWRPASLADDPLTRDRGRLGWSPSPPVRRTGLLRPTTIDRLGSGRWIVDFGQNLNGWTRLRRLGPAGTRVVLTHGEALDDDGDLTQANLDFAQPGQPVLHVGQVDEVVSRGVADDVFEPRHTTHGFRYVAIDGLDEPLTVDDVAAVEVRSDLRSTGRFACSDERLNALHRIAVASWRANSCEIPTDCPQRERWGYTGDFQIFVRSAAFLEDVRGFARKWLGSLADDQLDSGCITNVAPDCGVPENPWGISFDGSAGWGDAATIVPWALYTAYGDVEALRGCYPMMTAWVDYAARTAAEGRHPARSAARPEPAPHEAWLWDSGFHWGEWLEPDTPADFVGDKGIIATAYLSRSARIVSQAAAVLGHGEDAAAYGELADRTSAAWRTEYLHPDGGLETPTQANLVRALAFDLVPEELRADTARRLVARIESNGDRLSTGFLSTGLLLPVLADHGYADVAFRVLRQEREPGWFVMLARGATTVWEAWNGVDETGHAHESLNHYSKGAVITFLHEYVAGIRPLEPGYRLVGIRPYLDGVTTWAEGELDTVHGTVRSRWDVAGDVVTLQVTVPVGTSAVIELPDGTSERRGAGTHVLTSSIPAVPDRQRPPRPATPPVPPVPPEATEEPPKRWGWIDPAATPFGRLLDDRAARAVLLEVVPELQGNPMVEMAREVPLDGVLAAAGDAIGPGRLARLRARLAALPAPDPIVPRRPHA